MPEPKYLLMVPNAEHSMATGLLEVIPAVVSFMAGVLARDTLPSMNWTVSWTDTSGTVTLTVPPGAPAPINVTMWAADSVPNTGRRDFRLIGGYPNPGLQDTFWEKWTLEPTAPDTWTATVPNPPTGWSGGMIHAKFAGPHAFSGDHFPYESVAAAPFFCRRTCADAGVFAHCAHVCCCCAGSPLRSASLPTRSRSPTVMVQSVMANCCNDSPRPSLPPPLSVQ
jgi:hypothetical protein